jgi:hypothetical protein
MKVDEVPIVSGDEERRMFQKALGLGGPPAYMRRGRQVEEALEALLAKCRRQREEWLPMVRMRLGRLHALAGSWESLRPLFADEADIRALAELYADLQPALREPVAATMSAGRLRHALAELMESVAVFNRRWEAYLTKVDLTVVNALREAYNRFYVLEKECALRSPKVARQGFVPLPVLTRADLEAALPLLPVVRGWD